MVYWSSYFDTIFVVHPQYLLRHKDGGKFCESLRANPVRLTNMLSGQLQVQVSIKISASWKQLKPIHQQYLIHPLTKSDSRIRKVHITSDIIQRQLWDQGVLPSLLVQYLLKEYIQKDT